jgi:hypothetical protein
MQQVDGNANFAKKLLAISRVLGSDPHEGLG